MRKRAGRLGEVDAERPPAPRPLREQRRSARISRIGSTHDLDGRKTALAVTLNDNDIVAGHARHDIGALRFPWSRF